MKFDGSSKLRATIAISFLNLILGLLLVGCVSGRKSNLGNRIFEHVRTKYTPVTNETGTLAFLGENIRSNPEINDVINPDLLPEGREAIEEGMDINDQSTVIVHKMDSTGRIFDQVLNYDHKVLYEIQPTIKVLNTDYRQISNNKYPKYNWFVITDAKKGYVLPFNFIHFKETADDKIKAEMENLLGVQFLSHQKEFVPGNPKVGKGVNQKILDAYAQTIPALDWSASQLLAINWKSEDGPLVGAHYGGIFYFNYLSKKSALNQHIEVINQDLQVITPMNETWRLTDERAKTFKFEGTAPFIIEPAIAIMEVKKGGATEVRIVSGGGHNELAGKLDTAASAQANKLVSDIDEQRKIRLSKMASFDDVRATILANNKQAIAAARAKLVAEKGECYLQIKDEYFHPIKVYPGNRVGHALQAARKCPDQKSYHNLLLDLVRTNSADMNEKDLILLKNNGDAKMKEKMQYAIDQFHYRQRSATASAAAAENRRQRDIENSRSASQDAKNWQPGTTASRERDKQDDSAYRARQHEKENKQQLQKSLNRIGNGR